MAPLDARGSDHNHADPVGAAADRERETSIVSSQSLCASVKRSSLEDVLAHLRSIGYEKRDPVEMVGEYSVRGGILDVFPAEAAQPVRIEFFGDLIESMRRFDVESQRSVRSDQGDNAAAAARISEVPRVISRHRAGHAGSASQCPGEEFPGWEFWVPRRPSARLVAARPGARCARRLG